MECLLELWLHCATVIPMWIANLSTSESKTYSGFVKLLSPPLTKRHRSINSYTDFGIESTNQSGYHIGAKSQFVTLQKSNPFDFRADYGLATYDERRAALINAIYATRFG